MSTTRYVGAGAAMAIRVAMLSAALVLQCAALPGLGQQPAEYTQRLQQDYRNLFATYDVNHDGVLTRDEARASNQLAPLFDSMDINRDGQVTSAELERWLADMPLAAR